MNSAEVESGQAPQLNDVEVARVGWLELFYDLVVVAWLAHTNLLILESEEGSLIPLVLGAGFVLYIVWMTMTTINNKFPSSGLMRRTTMFAQMFLMIVAMLSFDPGGLPTTYGMVAIALIFVSCGIAYLDVGARIPAVRRSMVAAAGATLIAAGFCVLGAWRTDDVHLSAGRAIPFAVVGAVVVAIPLVAFYTHRAQGAFRIQQHHLDERWGQLTLITLGESFLLFSEELAGKHEIPNIWMFLLVFVAIVALWRLYFDSAMRRPYDTEPEARHYFVLIVAQFFLIIGIITTIDALVDAVTGISHNSQQVFGVLVIGSIVFLVSLALLTWGRRGRIEGVVITNLVMALVIGHWVQIYVLWNEDVPDEWFVVGICAFVIAYAWCINLVDDHANRLIQSRLPIGSKFNQAAPSGESTQT